MLDEKQVYEFDEFRLDLRKRQLICNDEVVPLYSKAFDLLAVLVKNSGRDLTKDELLDSVWPGQILEEANLSVTVSAVRKALREKASQPRYIVTIPGRGYRFVADFRDGRLEPEGLVVECETISQITVEEDEIPYEMIEAAKPVKLISDGETTNLDVSERLSPYHSDRKSVADFSLGSVFKSRLALVATALTVLILTITAVFLIRRFQQARVGTRRFANIKVTQVTNVGRLGGVAISSDGKLFAFNLKGIGENNRKFGLYLGQTNGEKTIELISPAEVIYRSLEYASDGSAIFFSEQDQGRPECALFRISVLGGLPVKLHDNIGFYFAVAPGDRQAAFLRDDSASKSISLLITNLDSGNEAPLMTLPVSRRLGRFISWSPDGSTIAFAANHDANESDLGVFLVQVSSGQVKALTAQRWRDIRRMVWLKDSSGLLMIAAGTEPEDTRQVWFVASPTGEARRITNDPSLYDWGLSVPADPDSFLLVQLKQFNNLWVGPVDDLGKAKQITFATFNLLNGNFVFDWMPNNKIVYAASQARGLNLWTMDADGTNVRELTPPGNDDGYPSASADGRFIVFSSRRSGSEQIWRIDADGSHPKQLTTCSGNSQPSVSPDGNWVVYISTCDGAGALWRVPIEGGQPQRLTEKAAAWPWISPDGKWIACGYESIPNRWQLAIVPIEGGPPAKLFDVAPLAVFNFAVRWTPDGKAVTYRESSRGLWRQPIEGGPPQQIPNLPEDKIYCYGWSHDGKLFAFSRGIEIRDAVLVSNAP